MLNKFGQVLITIIPILVVVYFGWLGYKVSRIYDFVKNMEKK